MPKKKGGKRKGGRDGTIEELLKHWCEKSIIETYKCNNCCACEIDCKKCTLCKKRITLEARNMLMALPQAVLLNIQRIRLGTEKRTDMLNLPEEGIDLSHISFVMERRASFTKSLLPSYTKAYPKDSGHYRTFLKKRVDWYYCDDANISKVKSVDWVKTRRLGDIIAVLLTPVTIMW
ncbi:hypothetical protein M501DRAFT_597261 [Patellaria atrata CBS 101060]|uniref:Peptidase C19 ubiquitin carboxyl-terminal hydrolase domain-containing protein n=1 Tax=Patellaria atrata CBS 101060 TaxID=1346257 RepID=A0A9P4VN99_9PEZI|nr:hypothetical protein M501DRAFT_597261 [Patellaria atrata CBS 101060]